MDFQTEQELRKIWRALRCKADCNYSGLTFNNGLTRAANNVQLGGDLTQDTTIQTIGFNVTFNDAVDNINFGIKEADSGNKAFIAEHTDSIFTHYIINKLEGEGGAIGSDYDINGLATVNTSTGDFVANFTGVDNTTGEIIAGMFYSDATDVYEIRLDINGLRVQFNSTPIITIKPSGIISAPLPTYANDAAAGLAGLVAGDLYQTVTAGEGFVKIKQ